MFENHRKSIISRFTSVILRFTSVILRFTSVILRFTSVIMRFTSVILIFTIVILRFTIVILRFTKLTFFGPKSQIFHSVHQKTLLILKSQAKSFETFVGRSPNFCFGYLQR